MSYPPPMPGQAGAPPQQPAVYDPYAQRPGAGAPPPPGSQPGKYPPPPGAAGAPPGAGYPPPPGAGAPPQPPTGYPAPPGAGYPPPPGAGAPPQQPAGYPAQPPPTGGAAPPPPPTMQQQQQQAPPPAANYPPPQQQQAPPSGAPATGYPPPQPQAGGYPPQPPQAGGYPPQQPQAGGYPPQPPQAGGYPPQPPQTGGYPPQPPQAGGYPPQPPQAGGYPPQAGGYPPQAGGYPPQPPQAGATGGQTVYQAGVGYTAGYGPGATGAAAPGVQSDPDMYVLTSADPATLPRPPPDMEDAIDLVDVSVPNPHANVPHHDRLTAATPRYFALSMTAIPTSQALMNKSKLTLGAIISPLADREDEDEGEDDEVPVVQFSGGIVRCRRCRTYVNPFVQFIDGGRRWRCNLCFLPNEVPSEYFCSLDSEGIREDLADHPELTHGSVEFIAPSEYMVRPPQAPIYLFVLDVSYTAVHSGMLKTALDTIRECLDDLPEDRTQIGFIMFDTEVTFVSLRDEASQPKFFVVPDIEDCFLPQPEDMLLTLDDSNRELVDSLLDTLLAEYTGTQRTDVALGAALQGAQKVLNPSGGKMMVFCCSLPMIGVARLQNRSDPRLNIDAKAQLEPAQTFYKNLAVDASRHQIGIDVFLFSSHYTDVATISCLARFTGGQLYYYPTFSAQSWGPKFNVELSRNLTRNTGFESVMRVRCSRGLRINNFHGNFFIRASDLLALPTVDSDKSFGVTFAMEEATLSVPNVYMQSALLYTTSNGERRIRIHTVAIPVLSSLPEVYKRVNASVLANLHAKTAVDKVLHGGVKAGRDFLLQSTIDVMHAYRTHASGVSKTLPNLVMPSSLKLLPLYSMAALKNVCFRPEKEVPSDERVAMFVALKMMSASVMPVFLYPRLFRVSEAGSNEVDELPPTLPLMRTSLATRGAYLLENSQAIYMWVGREVSHQFIQDVFGLATLEGVHGYQLVLAQRENALSARINAMIDILRSERTSFLNLVIIKQGDQLENIFLNFLVEDRSSTVHSYGEYLAHVHTQVTRNLK